MLHFFAPVLRLHLACLTVLLAALGLSQPAVAASEVAAITATQMSSRDGRPKDRALVLPSEALGAEAIAPRGPGLGLFPSLPLASLPATPTWRTAATLAAHAVPQIRIGEVADYFRTRLLLAALSPQAP